MIEQSNFTDKALSVTKIMIGVIVLGLAVFLAAEVFLLIFAGMLLAVFLISISRWVENRTGFSHGVSLGMTLLVLVLAISASAYFLAPSVAKQVDQLTQTLPQSVSQLKSEIAKYSWGQTLIEKANPQQMINSSGNVFSRATGVVSNFLGWFANFIIILFIGIYGAVEPRTYRNGLLHLIPKHRRARIAEVVTEVHETLSWWLIGKFFDMAVIGIFTTLGLWLLNVPLALILGIIASIFTFIPNIGPTLAAIPAVLLGLTISPQKALYVALMYIGIQFVESYILTPLVQRKAVSLPPGLTLGAQVLLGVIFGALGVALATPLMAAGLVITKMLYVEDTLGDPITSE